MRASWHLDDPEGIEADAMSYKTILAHLNDEQRCPGLLKAAVQVARTNAAHIVGLAVMPPIIIMPGSEAGAGTVIEDHREKYRPQLARMRAAFTTALEDNDVQGEWLELDCESEDPFGDVDRVAVTHARTADLVVASIANPAWSLSAYLDVHETLVMESGRPVLLLPNSPMPAQIGKRVLLAWNNTREAARAAFDALPLLKAADVIWVAQIDESKSSDEGRTLPRTDICKALARHDVRCELLPVIAAENGAGSTLLQTAQQRNADLLVMGCYGHSRLRELIFGGASRHVLQHMRIPVLMSH